MEESSGLGVRIFRTSFTKLIFEYNPFRNLPMILSCLHYSEYDLKPEYMKVKV